MEITQQQYFEALKHYADYTDRFIGDVMHIISGIADLEKANIDAIAKAWLEANTPEDAIRATLSHASNF